MKEEDTEEEDDVKEQLVHVSDEDVEYFQGDVGDNDLDEYDIDDVSDK